MENKEMANAELISFRLTPDEIDNPAVVISDFFLHDNIIGIKKTVWDILYAMTSGSFHTMESDDRANIMFFFEMWDKLLDALYLIHEREQEQQPEG